MNYQEEINLIKFFTCKSKRTNITIEPVICEPHMKNSNVFSKIQDVSDVTSKDKFDLISAFDAIHDQPRPDMVLKNIYHSL